MPNAMSDGATSGKWLWRAVYKINHDDGGFTYTVWIADKNLADARTASELIGDRIRKLLPQDAEIYDAKLHRWDTLKRNAWQLNGVEGQGLYGSALAVPVELKCDNPRTALKIRFETVDGIPVPRLFNLIPDAVIAGADLVDAISNVVGVPAVPAAPAATAVYDVQFTYLLEIMMLYTHHVEKNPVPGGLYTFHPWENAYVDHVSTKKGGRVFIG